MSAAQTASDETSQLNFYAYSMFLTVATHYFASDDLSLSIDPALMEISTNAVIDHAGQVYDFRSSQILLFIA